MKKEKEQSVRKRVFAGEQSEKEKAIRESDRESVPQKLTVGKQTNQDSVPVNTSPHQFNECPDRSLLRSVEQSRIDPLIRRVRKTKNYLDLISDHEILRLTPLEDEIIRVQFRKGKTAEFEPGYWNYEPDSPIFWTAKAGKSQVAVDTEKIAVRIDKKTGALWFLDKNGKRLLSEKTMLPRQIEEDAVSRTWVHFDLPDNEKIFAKGILKKELLQMNHKARYISFGGKKLRMPLLVSAYGYGIGIAAEEAVMCCMIPMYGTYLYTEGKAQIDYYFLYGGNDETVLELYQKLSQN